MLNVAMLGGEYLGVNGYLVCLRIYYFLTIYVYKKDTINYWVYCCLYRFFLLNTKIESI